MLVYLADFMLWLCFALSLVQTAGLVIDKKYTKSAAITFFIALSFCFAALIYSFAISDFSLKIVFNNSHLSKPFVYKIAGTWGNHEGSLLTLTWIMAAYGFIYSFTKFNPKALAIQGFICFLFIVFIKFTSNPFEFLPIPAENGRGLNPLLQDIGLALHPPGLYMGYVGFSLVFSICVAALLDGKVNQEFAKSAKAWCMASWTFLSLGIGLGSWWAYRELGWGGFWFWDPVENASLMPWLSGTALLHSLIIVEKRGELKKWTLLLGIFTFGLSLLGFFLVRSGVITSVHSFATDPVRGKMIILILFSLIGSALALYGMRAHKIKSEGGFNFVSRESGVVMNNIILSAMCGSVLIGTLYPLLLNALVGEQISVGEPYFNAVFAPLSVALIYLCAFATAAKWGSDSFKNIAKKLAVGLVLGLLVAVHYLLAEGFSIIEALGLMVAVTLLASVADEAIKKFSVHKLPMILAHGGIAVLSVGILFTTSFATKNEMQMKIGDKQNMAEFDFQLLNVVEGFRDNYAYRKGIFEVFKDNKQLKNLEPEMRVYVVEQQATTEAAIAKYYLSDLYAVIGEKAPNGSYAVRLYFKPLVNLIWLGVIMMFIGGSVRIALNFVRI